MNEKMYVWSMGAFGTVRYYATETEGQRIADEVNRRRVANDQCELEVHKVEFQLATFDGFFKE